MADDDRLAEIKEEAAVAFGFPPQTGERLRGCNRQQVYDDARRLRDAAPLPRGGSPSFETAVHVWRADRARRWARVFLR